MSMFVIKTPVSLIEIRSIFDFIGNSNQPSKNGTYALTSSVFVEKALEYIHDCATGQLIESFDDRTMVNDIEFYNNTMLFLYETTNLTSKMVNTVIGDLTREIMDNKIALPKNPRVVRITDEAIYVAVGVF